MFTQIEMILDQFSNFNDHSFHHLSVLECIQSDFGVIDSFMTIIIAMK
jgi:hypothetical protein